MDGDLRGDGEEERTFMATSAPNGNTAAAWARCFTKGWLARSMKIFLEGCRYHGVHGRVIVFGIDLFGKVFLPDAITFTLAFLTGKSKNSRSTRCLLLLSNNLDS